MDGQGIEITTPPAIDGPSVLAGYAVSQPDNAAILSPGKTPLSFAALFAQQEYVREALEGWGIGRGDPVAVLLPKGPEMAVAIAVLPVSATAVPLDLNLSSEDYESMFRRCSAKALILPRGLQHNARVAADRSGLFLIELEADPDAPAGAFELAAVGVPDKRRDGEGLGPDIAYVLSTSGTTSQRKLIPYHHNHIVPYAETMKTWFRFESTDLSIHLVPMYFAHGIKASLMVPLLSGTSIICPPAYKAKTFFTLLDEYRPTWITAGFTIYRDILHHVGEYRQIASETRLRFMRCGAGRLEPDEIARLEKAFDTPLIVGLGSTESGSITCNPIPPRTRKIDSVGVPTANEVRLRDENGHFVEVGREGEIVARGPLVFGGYLDDPLANEQVFIDGWYRTGDLGKFDEDGFLYLTGRVKEVINRGGEKISPTEIDRTLESHPAVAEGAAFGIPHPTLGELVVAAVVPLPGADTDERDIRRHVRLHFAASKVPSKIFFVDRLPRAENGKLRRNKLCEAVALS
jgi:acyl-CoA synthetase (AMP-forming)/AMP-acid ligase II